MTTPEAVPELPKPTQLWDGGDVYAIYTADQIREYGQACIAAERARAALLVDDLARMMENGAGEHEPGGRLRQASRNIRDPEQTPMRWAAIRKGE
jgi:hypothetical protein